MTVNPGAAENCSDGIDNDCDGLIDIDPECTVIFVPDDEPTIQDAIDVAEYGNLILVEPGIYRERINFVSDNVQVRSVEGPYKTIIDGGKNGTVVIFSSYETEAAVLDGFTIRNGTGTYIIFDHPAGFGAIVGGGIYCWGGTTPTITNCRIIKNHASFGGGIYIRGSRPNITNCLISNNWATGLIFGGGGIYFDDSSPDITNCTITANFARYYGGGIFCWGSSPVITNSIFWYNYSMFDPEIHVRSGSPVVTYSDVKNGWPGEGNIDANPLFIKGGDYHLTMISPCIDTGTDTGIYIDIDSQSRPWGAGFDMGADEFRLW